MLHDGPEHDQKRAVIEVCRQKWGLWGKRTAILQYKSRAKDRPTARAEWKNSTQKKNFF